MGATLTRRAFHRLLGRLEHRGKGILPTIETGIATRRPDVTGEACLTLVQQRIRPEVDAAWKRGAEVFRTMANIARGEPGGMIRLTDGFAEDPVWQTGLEEDLSATIAHLDTIVKGLESLREMLETDENLRTGHEEVILELRGIASRIADAMIAFRATLRPDPGGAETVRWVEFRPSRDRSTEDVIGAGNVVLAAAPLRIGGVLRDTLFGRIPTVVMTSATLATEGGFGFVRERLGLDGVAEVEEAVYPSPFDFESQALLVIPSDVPIPAGETTARHARATERIVSEMAELSDGGVFVLFTSHQALGELAAALRRSKVAGRWPLFVQGEDARPRLIEKFIGSGRGILLGTNSFWEGVDVPGDPLRGIVIPRLPFKVPSEPITAARVEAIEAAGGNAFNSYMLPSAAIRLKQGFGRLIRSRGDRGAVVLLDARVLQKRYGRFLLDSLPPARRFIGSWKECREELKAFHAPRSVPFSAVGSRD
jgi:ATP-dependent DNA helicase DinG